MRHPTDDQEVDVPTTPSVGTICLVEDHPLLREQLVGVLTGAGHHVVATAGTKAEGFTAITRHLPDLAVIDNRLPDGFGIELCRHLAVEVPAVRLVLHSGSVDDELLAASRQAGVAAVIAKSIRPTLLLEAIALSLVG